MICNKTSLPFPIPAGFILLPLLHPYNPHFTPPHLERKVPSSPLSPQQLSRNCCLEQTWCFACISGSCGCDLGDPLHSSSLQIFSTCDKPNNISPQRGKRLNNTRHLNFQYQSFSTLMLKVSTQIR